MEGRDGGSVNYYKIYFDASVYVSNYGELEWSGTFPAWIDEGGWDLTGGLIPIISADRVYEFSNSKYSGYLATNPGGDYGEEMRRQGKGVYITVENRDFRRGAISFRLRLDHLPRLEGDDFQEKIVGVVFDLLRFLLNKYPDKTSTRVFLKNYIRDIYAEHRGEFLEMLGNILGELEWRANTAGL